MQERKRKRAAPSKRREIESKPVRRICILFHDPDATDSSGDEEDDSLRLRRKKRIFVPLNPNPIASSSPFPGSRPGKRPNAAKFPRAGSDEPGPQYKGVRQRPWGKWVSEVRDPIRGVRKWLGTFTSAEEASKAYQEASLRFKAEKLGLQCSSNHGPPSSSSSHGSDPILSHPSPHSVLEISTPACSRDKAAAPATAKPAIVPLPEDITSLEWPGLTEFFGEQNLLNLPEIALPFDGGESCPTFFVDEPMVDDFSGLNDLPLWLPEFDGVDFSFLN